ncbi:MAG TPA: succinate dehydrogenase, cytochrome b556 subunit [Steroidobacteraceae bacterium]|nr:succinate dehydrogenase, cytochrome b556 subunit [Steroidobacteraceae bacterium]
MPQPARPLSPHLLIYRWEIGMATSILHRLTGAALALGIVALCYWLISLAGGAAAYGSAVRVLWSPLGVLFLFVWTFCFFFHLLNGVRHLFWDAGVGFERAQRHMSGWIAVAGALALTLGVWLVIWHGAQA